MADAEGEADAVEEADVEAGGEAGGEAGAGDAGAAAGAAEAGAVVDEVAATEDARVPSIPKEKRNNSLQTVLGRFHSNVFLINLGMRRCMVRTAS